jgi:transposase
MEVKVNAHPPVTCGIDWAVRHHDVALVDAEGQLVAKRRISDDVAGFAMLSELLAEAGDSKDTPIPVAIETPRGLLVAALRATGRRVYAINPMAVARYRERWTVARSKSDHADAVVLANILRTDAHAHRLLPADSELAQAVAVLARAHQDATWRRTKALQELRAHLREYYPSFLDAFAAAGVTNLASADARALLAIAPTPAAGATLTCARIACALRRGGRQRNIDQLAAAIDKNFRQHPDYAIITSFPGLAEVTGARVLAEIGDDRARFADARALKAYAGSAPVTRASGRSHVVTHRRIKNDRLAAVGYTWAFMAMTNSPPARAHYQRRKTHGDRHGAALRNLFNRMLGQLYHCLQTGQIYDPIKAFGEAAGRTNQAAA